MPSGLVEWLPWIVLAATMVVIIRRFSIFTVESVVGAFGIALLWVALYRWTEDRRFFFPYAIQFAVQTAILLAGKVHKPVLLGAGGLVLVFAVIRVAQGATAFVLLVELLVSAVILLVTAAVLRRIPHDAATRAVAGAAGSLAAYAGLLVN